MYNSANVLLGRIKKKYDFTGKQRFVATPLSFSGGVGSGTLPTSGVANYEDALITSTRVYATCEIEREAIKASADDKGAFVRATKETVQKCVESYMRNASRILFGTSDGILGVGDGAAANVSGAGSTGSPYIVEFGVSQWKEANWEEKDLVEMVTGGTLTNGQLLGGAAEGTLLEIVAVDPDNRQVSLVGTSARLATLSGAGPLAVTDGIAMQGSYLADPNGLKHVLDATSGSLYNIAVQRRWQATNIDAAGGGITEDLMNQVMLDVERKFGRAPNMIICSYVQYRKIMDLLDSQKRYNLPARDSKLKGKISFEGLEFMSTRGAIGIFPERFCDDDRIYFLNDNFIECHHRPGHGWFDDDGTVFLRKSNADEYEARYGGYYQNYIVPSAHGVLQNLAV